MNRVFITGATGYIGQSLVRRLLDESVEVTILVRNEASIPADIKDKVKSIVGEAADIVSLLGEIENGFDAFYHLAWNGVHPELRNNLDVQMENISMSLECVKAAASIKAHKFIYIGSAMEYMYCDEPINRDSVPSSSNFYGTAKIAAHYLCRELARQLDVPFIYTVVTSVYGIGREDKNVIFYVIDKLLNQEKPSVSKLEQRWDYIHIEDLKEALYRIGLSGKADGFYAVGNGENKPLSAYLEMVRDLIDPELPLGIGEVPYPKGRIPSSCINPTSLFEDTGFKPSIRFQEGIAEVIDFYARKRSSPNEI